MTTSKLRQRFNHFLLITALVIPASLALVASPAHAVLGEGGPGGGGHYCSAEFQSCPDPMTDCVWYGWCGTGGGGYGGGGGGGGGVESSDYGCSSVRGDTFAFNGYAYVDLGSCPTIAICNTKAAAINAAASGGNLTGRAVCGLSRANPESHGRHLFFRKQLAANVVPLGSDVEAEFATVEGLMTM